MVLAMVVPCFNEENRFDLLAWAEIISKTENCMWLFVNDGSLDETFSVLSRLSARNVKVLDLRLNVGKGEAIRSGFAAIMQLPEFDKIQQIGFIDSDGAFGLDDILNMVSESKSKLGSESHYGLIIGSRVQLAGRDIRRNTSRHYLGRIIASVICLGWKSAPYDTQSGFKIFKCDSNFIESVKNPFITSWFFDIEIMLRLEKLGSLHPWEVPLTRWHEIEGGSIKLKSFISIGKQIFSVKVLVNKHLKLMQSRSKHFTE
jgi:dolichyl-phosphate beta-glucosyltransferase